MYKINLNLMSRSQNKVAPDGRENTNATNIKGVNGPQIVFDKEFLCMKSVNDEISTDQVKITNVGSTTIYFVWKKVERGDYIPAK